MLVKSTLLYLGLIILGVGCTISEEEYLNQQASMLRDKVYYLQEELKAVDSTEVALKRYKRTGRDRDYEDYLAKRKQWEKLHAANEKRGYH